MPDASGRWFYNALYEQLCDHEEAVVRLSAMSVHEEVIKELEGAASRLIDSWRHDFQSAVSHLDADDRVKLDEIWHPHGVPVPGTFALPETIKTRTQKVVTDAKGKATIEDLEAFQRHLFSDANGDYPMVATGWEKDVITKELAQPGLLGWYRTPSSGAGGLSVSYIEGAVDKSMFPDFLFFYLADGKIVVDYVDPHNHSLGDTPGKWAALSRFARQNPRIAGNLEVRAATMAERRGDHASLNHALIALWAGNQGRGGHLVSELAPAELSKAVKEGRLRLVLDPETQQSGTWRLVRQRRGRSCPRGEQDPGPHK